MQRLLEMFTSFGYTDFIMIGGIAAIVAYLWSSSRSKAHSTMVDLKKLKVLPSNIDDNLNTGSSGTGSAAEKSLVERMRSSGKSIVVFFGSQTGTGEEFARRLAKNSRLYGLKTLVVDPEEINLVNIFLIL